MKKRSQKIIVLWVLIALVTAAGTFLVSVHLGIGSKQNVKAEWGGGMGTDDAMGASADMEQDNPASDTVSDISPMKKFFNNGYSFVAPADWSIEQTANDTAAIHPASSSPDAACKIEISAFAYSSDEDMADWIAQRIGADPSLSVTEQSSEEVSVSGGTGVKWIGTIDGIPTTLVYAFGDQHAYEIAPSLVGEGADGAARCGSMLQTFLSAFTI
jgi:hypothetical protein